MRLARAPSGRLKRSSRPKKRARSEADWRGVFILFFMWGAIWLVANLATQFYPNTAGLAWLVLDAIGVTATIFVLSRAHSRVAGPWFRRVMMFWLSLFVYAALWLFLMAPLTDRQFGTFLSTIAAFGFVAMGLWLPNRLFIWFGLFITAVMMAGYLWAGPWLWLWTAVAGGGAFIVAGIFIRLKWRR